MSDSSEPSSQLYSSQNIAMVLQQKDLPCNRSQAARLALSDEHSGVVQPGDHRLFPQNRQSARRTLVAAFDMAKKHRPFPKEVILHLDRGAQYASKAFRKRLKNRMLQSIGNKGNLYGENRVNLRLKLR